MNRQFAVIGLGRFGASVARTLYDMGSQVLGIDADDERVRAIVQDVTRAVAADATDEQVLRSLGVRNFDVVILGIGSDVQASIMTTLLLKELGVETVVAKAKSEAHGKVLLKVGADRVVFPERDMGFQVAQGLISPNILEYIALSPDVGMVEMVAPTNFIGKKLIQLDLRNRFNINVIALKHGENVNITPRADDEIKKGDILVVVGTKEHLHLFEQQWL